MILSRHLSQAGVPIEEQIIWEIRDGTEVPTQWSDIAASIFKSKYLRRAGVPSETVRIEDNELARRLEVPEWLLPSRAAEGAALGGETSARQVFHRLAGCWTYHAWLEGLVRTQEMASVLYDEIYLMLANQWWAPNSPQWFNTGLNWAYGIHLAGVGHWATPLAGGAKPAALEEVYERPQVSACFIQSIKDDLVNPGGIMDLALREARLFKYGSGTGTNFSALRSQDELLSGGGKASGMMSFLRISDRAAGAIKSGGTCLTADTPVMTERGFQRVADLAESGAEFIAFSLEGQKLRPKYASAFLSGVKECVRVTTDKGTFEVSYDHPFLTKTGVYRRAATLRPGDRLSQARLAISSEQPPTEQYSGSCEEFYEVAEVEQIGLRPVYDVQVRCDSPEDRSPQDFHNFAIGSLNPEALWVGYVTFVHNTRRAAKMDIVNLDHPEIEDFIWWKVREEEKAAAISVGSKVLKYHLLALYDTWGNEPAYGAALRAATKAGVPAALAWRVAMDRDEGRPFNWRTYELDWECEALDTVSGQNSNNSVRIPGAFLDTLAIEGTWELKARLDGAVVKRLPARDLWRQICEATWAAADPGVQYDDIINDWHTCPADGRINASNPCFTGDTRVWTAAGPKTFAELAASGATIAVLTELEDGKLAYRDMVAPRLTRQDAELVRVRFHAQHGRRGSTFTEVRVTPDHVFYLVGGGTCRAADLRPGDRIESAYRRKANQKGYVGIQATSGDGVMEHYLVAEYDHGRRPAWPTEHGRHLNSKENTTSGERNPNFGNIGHLSDRRWITDGQRNRRMPANEDLPEGWRYGKIHANHTVVAVEKLEEKADVYCGTIPATGRFFIALGDEDFHWEGVLVANCSEYLFLDDTACNLASQRLTAFLKEDGSFDVPAFVHSVRFMTIVLEVSVYMASYPSELIAARSYLYRTLGGGYADLGGLLMRMGIPYDSPVGRAWAAGLTALLTGVAYETSSVMASELGPFPRWEANAADMKRVLRNHARAAGVLEPTFEGLSVRPYQIDLALLRDLCPDLADEVKASWEAVLQADSFRNAQVTVIAPTGTISFVMDCDTTGAEPDFALVKVKSLVGEEQQLTIVNNGVSQGLRALDYGDDRIASIEGWLKEHKTLDGCPDIKAEHRAVFATTSGKEPISWRGHVLMVAAIQPFVSGGISKTVNLQRTATAEDVESVYLLAHATGVKCLAPFRDGCKLNQPLRDASASPSSALDEGDIGEGRPPPVPLSASETKVVSLGGTPLPRGVREYLPWRREDGITQKVKIAGHSVFLTMNPYSDGRPGEVFLELGHEGSTLRGMANLAAMMTSLALQYGAPVQEIVERLAGTRFEPAGPVEGHDRIKMVTSIGDFVARELGLTFLGAAGEQLADVTSAKEVVQGNQVVALDKRAVGLSLGYTGDLCSRCGSYKMVRTGACASCSECGEPGSCG